MGLKCSLDFAQEVMENIFRNIKEVDIYIVNLGHFPMIGNTMCKF